MHETVRAPPPLAKSPNPPQGSETPKNLLNETAISLEDEAIHIAQIKAQRIEVKPKIALATEESVRAFTIWHLNKDHGESHTFYPYLKSPKTPLSSLLLKPILDTFNMGFPGDEELIKSRISKPWISLDSHTTGLEDETIPGYLILMCMVDAVVVMTYALSHRVKQGYGGFLGGTSENTSQSVLTKGELEKACDWFTNVKSNKQEQLHKMIQDLLDDEGQPKGNDSITNLQMKIIETVELFSDHAECASTGILASAADWWRVKK